MNTLFILFLPIVTSRMNEYIPLLNTQDYLTTHINNYDLPKSWNWGDINGTNYLTKNLNQHIFIFFLVLR